MCFHDSGNIKYFELKLAKASQKNQNNVKELVSFYELKIS